MKKRVRKLGENLRRLIGDDEVIEILRPINATLILKVLLKYSRQNQKPTQSMIARELNISPSTVVRNVENFNKKYLVETKLDARQGKQYEIWLTENGLKIARIIENSETIDLIEDNRTKTVSLMKTNENFVKDLNAIIRVREIRNRELEKQKKVAQEKIATYPKEKDIVSRIRMKELQQFILMADNEIFENNKYINEQKKILKELKMENRSLQHKLDEFIPVTIEEE